MIYRPALDHMQNLPLSSLSRDLLSVSRAHLSLYQRNTDGQDINIGADQAFVSCPSASPGDSAAYHHHGHLGVPVSPVPETSKEPPPCRRV